MNLIFTAFATLEGYREGSNANLGSEVFYRCIVVSLVSAKQKNQNCDAALVTNTAVPEPYAAQLSQAGIRVIACPFDNYRFEADLDWSLAYYKLCAMQYLLETEHYENYLMLDSDTFTQRGYQDIWREAAEAVLLYQVPHAASQPMTARISHTYDELWPEGAPHVLTHFGGEFVAAARPGCRILWPNAAMCLTGCSRPACAARTATKPFWMLRPTAASWRASPCGPPTRMCSGTGWAGIFIMFPRTTAATPSACCTCPARRKCAS